MVIMKKYRIVYWYNGNKLVATTEAADEFTARYLFEMYVPNDDVIEITEIKDE
ncbi:MAG: hypothetical protein ACI4MS_07705 [Candidatus Coproplasma sp.]